MCCVLGIVFGLVIWASPHASRFCRKEHAFRCLEYRKVCLFVLRLGKSKGACVIVLENKKVGDCGARWFRFVGRLVLG